MGVLSTLTRWQLLGLFTSTTSTREGVQVCVTDVAQEVTLKGRKKGAL
jgi:hypothetical protein